jgi:hypothetical protein
VAASSFSANPETWNEAWCSLNKFLASGCKKKSTMLSHFSRPRVLFVKQVSKPRLNQSGLTQYVVDTVVAVKDTEFHSFIHSFNKHVWAPSGSGPCGGHTKMNKDIPTGGQRPMNRSSHDVLPP